MRVKWRPSKRLSRFAQRSEWFKHIKDDFEAIFQSTAKIWSTLIDETSHRSIYTNCPEKCLWFTNDGKVKVLPNLDHGASSSSNDIDRLQQFMMQIITMSFGHTGDYTIYQENYNLSRDLKSFLFHATDKNLAYVSPRFLLGSQSFVMDASERSKFIVNLEFVLIVVQGLSGMVRQAKVHGNACLESVVVMRTLDRKLHAFDVLSEYDGAKWNCYRTIAGNACVDASKTTYITVI
ncbi:hypothetical protein V6N13_032934 [Hibiscus sabdariffa]